MLLLAMDYSGEEHFNFFLNNVGIALCNADERLPFFGSSSWPL